MQRHYFDFFMKSFSKLHGGIQKQDQEYNPWNEANPNPLSVFVNKALSSTNRTLYLVSNYSPGNNSCSVHSFHCHFHWSLTFFAELAALYFQRSDMDRARYYVRQSYRHFISSLSRLHPLASNSRYLKLQGVQKVGCLPV
jgi:hypothetical protein